MAMRPDTSTQQRGPNDKPVANPTGQPLIQVKVYSPYQVYFDQAALSISAQNATGPFDILPHHHKFITLLQPCELVIRTEFGRPRIKIGGGVMHVKADQVIVFLDV